MRPKFKTVSNRSPTELARSAIVRLCSTDSGFPQDIRTIATDEFRMRFGGRGDALTCFGCGVERPRLLDQIQRELVGENFA